MMNPFVELIMMVGVAAAGIAAIALGLFGLWAVAIVVKWCIKGGIRILRWSRL